MKYEYKIENGKLFRRPKVYVERMDAGNCYYCHEPVYVSEGQILKYKIIKINDKKEEYPTHKKCRKEAKRKGRE